MPSRSRTVKAAGELCARHTSNAVPLSQLHAGSSTGPAGIRDKAAAQGAQMGGTAPMRQYHGPDACETVHILVSPQERLQRPLEQKSKICPTALKVLEATVCFQQR